MAGLKADRDAWLRGLKAGDEVLVQRSRGLGTISKIGKIERLTKTLIIVNGVRFRKADGCEPGDGYRKAHIDEATAEARQACVEARERRKFTSRCEKMVWSEFSIETLRAVSELVRDREDA